MLTKLINTLKKIGTQEKSYGHYDHNVWGYTFFSDQAKDTWLSIDQLMKMYTWWSYVCINIISENFFKLDRKLLWSENRFDREKKDDSLKLITNTFLEEVAWFLEIHGTVFVRKHIFGTTIEKLEVLRSDLVSIEDIANDWKRYCYNHNWKLKYFSEDEVFVIKTFSPYKNWYGISSLSSVGMQQNLDTRQSNIIETFLKIDEVLGQASQQIKKSQQKKNLHSLII